MSMRLPNKLAVLLLMAFSIPAGTQADEPRPQSAGGILEDAETPWFWPNPYPHLGHVSMAGDGWQYMRLAADAAVGKELGLDPQQREALAKLWSQTEEKERQLGQQRQAEGRADPATWPEERGQVWLKAVGVARRSLTDKQHRRVKQLILQRLSYDAFARDEVAEHLDMNQEQRRKIGDAIAAHLQRLKAKDDEIEGLIKRLGTRLGFAVLQQRVDELKRHVDARGPYGRQSHRQVWTDIHEVLSPEQRDLFTKLRGPMPESVRPLLKAFDSAE